MGALGLVCLRRVAADNGQETWYIYAATERLYHLAEAHVRLDAAAKSAIVDVFPSDSCPTHRELIEYFLGQVIPADLDVMVAVYSRGLRVDAWCSLRGRPPALIDCRLLERVAALGGSAG